MDEVINKLLTEKGYHPEDDGYDEEKERLTAYVEDKLADAMVDAIVEEDRLMMLKKVLTEEPENAEKIREVVQGSEIKVKVLEEAMENIRKEYLEGK